MGTILEGVPKAVACVQGRVEVSSWGKAGKEMPCAMLMSKGTMVAGRDDLEATV